MPLFQPLGSNFFGDMGQTFSDSQMQQLSSLIGQQSQEIWNREDSAVQRWVKDVEAAGLNPYGFTGQGAATGQVVPSMNSLTSVLGMITSNLSAQDLGRKYINQAQNFVSQLLDMYTSSMRSIGSLFSSF